MSIVDQLIAEKAGATPVEEWIFADRGRYKAAGVLVTGHDQPLSAEVGEELTDGECAWLLLWSLTVR